MTWNWRQRILSIGVCVGIISVATFSQDSLFVQRNGVNLGLGGRPFYAIGVNCYYLQNLAAYGDTAHLIEIFREAQQLGITTVRAWGFFDGEDSTNPAIIQYAHGQFAESGLRALDYVVAKAKEYSIRLIIPLVNNWDDFGGMNQYVRWLARMTPLTTQQRFEGTGDIQKIYGAGGRSYVVHTTETLAHDDFYRDSTIRQWYKNYIGMLFNRVNVFTGRMYKDEPAILAWELANEPRSSDRTGSLVSVWASEMSTYLKLIDTNHLIGVGEEGYDVFSSQYSHISSYADQQWLFDGTAGSSFTMNTSLPNIDIASVHCYPEDWGIPPSSAVTWMHDHQRLATVYNKPLIVGEVGIRRQMNVFFDGFFNVAFTENVSGILLWQFVYPGRFDNDGFAFSCPDDIAICSVILRYSDLYQKRITGTLIPPSVATLYQNFPNPFNYLTLISFDLAARDVVQLQIYNLLGQAVVTLVDGLREPGRHAVLFDATSFASGVYIVRLTSGSVRFDNKMMLVK